MKSSFIANAAFAAILATTLTGCRTTEQAEQPVVDNSAQNNNAWFDTSKPGAKLPIKIGTVVPVGYIAYRVESATFSESVEAGGKPVKAASGKQFLTLKMTLRNTDFGGKEHSSGELVVMDTGNSAYSLSDKAKAVAKSLKNGGKIKPGEALEGVAVFEVPTEGDYLLKIKAAPPVTDEQTVVLTDNRDARREKSSAASPTPPQN